MNFPDKVTLTMKDNQKLVIKEMITLVYSMSRLSGGKATLREAETVILGSDVYGLSMEDTQLIRRLQSAVELVIRNDHPGSVEILSRINGLVTMASSLKAGQLRKAPFKVVATGRMIPAADEAVVANAVEGILHTEDSATLKALRLILVIVNQQFYADANEATAFLFANYVMVHAGAGMIMVTDEKLTAFRQLMAAYDGIDDEPPLKWLYKNCVISDH